MMPWRSFRDLLEDKRVRSFGLARGIVRFRSTCSRSAQPSHTERGLARDPGFELLFFFQLRFERLGFALAVEPADTNSVDGGAVGRRHHVGGVALRRQPFGDRLRLGANVERGDLY